jgi:hypothetical protein
MNAPIAPSRKAPGTENQHTQERDDGRGRPATGRNGNSGADRPTPPPARELLELMIARVTNRGPVDPATYRNARQHVLRNPPTEGLAPHCLQTCPHIDDVWDYIKRHQPPLPTYAQRRAYLAEQFAALLAAAGEDTANDLRTGPPG